MPLLSIAGLPGPPLDVPAGRTVLAAIHAAGHDWWHACGGKGRCTSCRVRLAAGTDCLSPPTAPELRYREAGRLGADERLACQARVSEAL
jgi:2Fe-2S ferredoxin